MGIIDDVKAIAQTIQQIDNIDLYKQILDLQGQILDVEKMRFCMLTALGGIALFSLTIKTLNAQENDRGAAITGAALEAVKSIQEFEGLDSAEVLVRTGQTRKRRGGLLSSPEVWSGTELAEIIRAGKNIGLRVRPCGPSCSRFAKSNQIMVDLSSPEFVEDDEALVYANVGTDKWVHLYEIRLELDGGANWKVVDHTVLVRSHLARPR